MSRPTFVIVGAGVAAATAADTLRSNGFDGRLVMAGAEPDPPYNRPTLSKERLRNEIDDAQALLHPAEHYSAKNIEILLEHRVRRVNVVEHTVEFASNGAALAYDRVLIATGAQLRRIAAPGTELPGVQYLRSLADCRRLNDALKQRPRVLVLGTGFIGCEVAASARMLGCEVTLAGYKAPLQSALGAEVGDAYTHYHRGQGTVVKTGTFVERFEGRERVERAHLFDGSVIECDVAVIGIGVEPSTDVVQNQPVETENGILVDEFCKSSAPRIYAAGDVASSWNPRYARRIRVEHFDNAQRQAVVAAKAMMGPTEPYNPVPSFWSDQYSYNLQYRGDGAGSDALVIRGEPQNGSFSAFYLRNGAVQAICSVNRSKENFAARRLLGKQVETRLLQDEHVDVKEMEV